MNRRQIAEILLPGLFLFSFRMTAAGAQTITNGGPSGTLVSASAVIPAPGATVLIYTTPAKGHFVLTQIGSASPCDQLFTATGFGPLGELFESLTTGRLSFEPGLVLPPKSSVECFDTQQFCTAGVSDCFMTGVLEK
jgi:hypothetical protein